MEPSSEVIHSLLVYEFQLRQNFQTAFDNINRPNVAKLWMELRRMIGLQNFAMIQASDGNINTKDVGQLHIRSPAPTTCKNYSIPNHIIPNKRCTKRHVICTVLQHPDAIQELVQDMRTTIGGLKDSRDIGGEYGTLSTELYQGSVAGHVVF
ncbi:hypothetical protein KIN20_009625 [Parelaphostrongylus tenuis]|uniref:Uncharacterized protein n=1 Tax=Parelaphostrongylus tenuis TaxID=148309 RepID=A0AAD5MSS7_PARTN|nr:hypothetical protein KIN20_009625 [Parelaphostrongylus tenuis]